MTDAVLYCFKSHWMWLLGSMFAAWFIVDFLTSPSLRFSGLHSMSWHTAHVQALMDVMATNLNQPYDDSPGAKAARQHKDYIRLYVEEKLRIDSKTDD